MHFLGKKSIKVLGFMILNTLVLSGCGSYRTLSQSDSEIKYGLNSYQTNCSSLPRVYSGVSYDFCKINSKTTEPAKQFKGVLYFSDVGLSAVLDTVVLPYSIYKQNKEGSIELK